MAGDFEIKNEMTKRILADVFCLAVVVALPSWAGLFLAVFFLLIFDNFYEILFFGLLLDALYGISGAPLGAPFVYTALAIGLFIGSVFLKRRLRL